MFRYKTDIVQLLKDSGFNSKYIRDHKIFSESTMTKFRNKNTSITLGNLSTLCSLLNCQLSDLIEYTCSNDDISKKLFDLRQQNDFSPSYVAEQFEIKRELYDKYENGTELVTLEVLLKACKFYNVPQSYFGINSDLVAVGNKGYVIKNTETSEVLEVTDEEFKMLKSFLEAYRKG